MSNNLGVREPSDPLSQGNAARRARISKDACPYSLGSPDREALARRLREPPSRKRDDAEAALGVGGTKGYVMQDCGIASIDAFEILDSRGSPTVQVTVGLGNGVAQTRLPDRFA